ncbi:DUF1330 domain-containing protein [Aquimarina sediminis]|uniref:DUF1330 domain-containing protein n=1 Tax=Aquimarina sediminis TaxID=2070536 RepID=UPI000CA00F65|nr:DUF1330 domain-containing protein [Aquimarina sediminis]
MGIINISTAIVKDETLFREYINKAAQLMKEQEVEVVCRGKYVETMRGSNLEKHIVAVFRYKDKKALEYFYNCESYKKIISLRDKACEMTIQIYSE